jgi:hypothetical protein
VTPTRLVQLAGFCKDAAPIADRRWSHSPNIPAVSLLLVRIELAPQSPPLPSRQSAHRPRVMMTMWAACLLVLAACGCTMPGRNDVSRLPARHQIRSDRLVIRSDFRLDEGDPLVAELHDLRREVRETLQLPEPQRTVAVYLFRDQERYSQYMKVAHPHLPERRAFFIGTPGELSVYAYLGAQVQEDLRHEYTHGLLHASLPEVPLWLDEGLAEYFEVNSTLPGRINHDHARGLAEMASHGWRPNLQRLELLEDVAEMQVADYQESWAWVHFLLHESDDGRQLLLDYLGKLATAQAAPSLAATILSELPAPDEGLTAYIATFTADEGRARLSSWER